MNTINNKEVKYPDSLRNVKDLQLGTIYLRYLGRDSFPSLLTIYEIDKPAILAHTEIKKIIIELKNTQLSDFAIKGLFSLGIAYFETMLSDLMKRQLQFYPQKITSIKANIEEKIKERKEIHISQSMINKGSIIEVIIENEIQKLSYKDIKSLLSAFCSVMSINLTNAMENIDNLIEIKETRNLLLHNNLYVNDFYLNKTKTIKRTDKIGALISIDTVYAIKSLEFILQIVENTLTELKEKFGKRTLLNMLQGLWDYTFKNRMIKFDDFATLNYEEDIYDGPFNEPTFLSSSEKTYMEFWKAQRINAPITNSSMVHLGSGVKLAFLVDVFGELRLTHW